MDNYCNAEQAVKVFSINGIDLYSVNTDKFKTSSIHFFFQQDLTRENVTKNALLPAVMRRGSVKHPTYRSISMELEMLYGASFDCGVIKKGERHVIYFYMEFLSKRFVSDGSDPFMPAFDMLFDIITNPVFENGYFREDYVAEEKDNLRVLIESRVNDKMRYSVDRCLEEVCSGERYSIFEYGFTEDIGEITAKGLTDQYKAMLHTYPLQVYLAGGVTDEETKAVIGRLSVLPRGNIRALHGSFAEKRDISVNHVTETMNVTQGKLCLGFRTNIAPDSADYYSLMVYNAILGGGIHSKLFQHVREKAGLAYYSQSHIEKFKGLMVISSGIETGNKDKAMEIISRQLKEIESGEISAYELDAAVKSLETGIKSLRDNQINIVDFYLGQTVSKTSDSFSDIIEKVKKVTKDDVVKVAQSIALDTAYFLTAPENAGNGVSEPVEQAAAADL